MNTTDALIAMRAINAEKESVERYLEDLTKIQVGHNIDYVALEFTDDKPKSFSFPVPANVSNQCLAILKTYYENRVQELIAKASELMTQA